MSELDGQRLAELREQVEARSRIEAELSAARTARIEQEDHAWATEACLAQVEELLRKLTGFGLTSLAASLSGSREQKLTQAAEQRDELEQHLAECQGQLKTLECQIEELQGQLESLGGVEVEYESLLRQRREQLETAVGGDCQQWRVVSEALDAAKAGVKTIERAADALEEVNSVLRNELGVAGTLGRCRVAEGCREIRALIDVSRRRTAGQCADRLRAAVGRLRRRVVEVTAALTADLRPPFEELDQTLSEHENAIDGQWLSASRGGSGPVDELVQCLQTADMLLERALTDAQMRSAQLEEERRHLIESA
jgi:vacuolar-type H+-ATPase subunit I/STV1